MKSEEKNKNNKIQSEDKESKVVKKSSYLKKKKS